MATSITTMLCLYGHIVLELIELMGARYGLITVEAERSDDDAEAAVT